ncbi:MAG: 2-hydroxyacid dehydrogenase [Acidimicrobiales bacterium]
MRVAVYSTKPYDEQFLLAANDGAGHELRFFESRLTPATVPLAAGAAAVCAFVNDDVGADVLEALAGVGVGLIVLRSAGYNHVDIAAATELDLPVLRVPGYSPHAVAEHCVGLILALNRNIHRAHNRVREGNFSLNGLLGFDLHGKTVGVIGTGKIGASFARAMLGFGCEVLASDPYPDDGCCALGVAYLDLDEVLSRADIVSLHCPLTPDTHHLIDDERLALMRPGVMLINTSRGALVDTAAVIDALKRGHIGHLGLDVYEEEADLFFEDLSDKVLHDDVFSRLLTFPNVLITGHQGFFTREAMSNIAATTIANLTAFERGEPLVNRVVPVNV